MLIEQEKVEELVARGAIFYVSHSAGKDSQAMYIALSRVVPHEQIVVVHADLGIVEWDGVQDHIKATIQHELNVVQATKTFFEMVAHRAKTRPDVPPWPSSATRQCTSDLKRGPIHKFIRGDMKARGARLAVNCTGIRAEESAARKKKTPFKLLDALCLDERTLKSGEVTPGREVYEYMPIHHLTTQQVFQIIHDADQEAHAAYKRNKRLSCVICIMGCDNDILHGAEERPDLVKMITDIENETGFTMFNGISLNGRIERARLAESKQLDLALC